MSRISATRWRILSPYLDQALDLDPEALPDWLADLDAREPAVAADLRAILAERQAAARTGFLDATVLDPRLSPPASLEGQTVGAYRLVSLIGQGGTGNVWLADRCDGRFHGEAAVKLLNADLVARAGERRFRREGTILARLRHPSIAHLIDAGLLPNGQPYLVLEHVDGLPIDRYCDERRLDLPSRLRLFLEVLDAVAHAHAKLVVHRDIKPANVLVSAEGGVKLLDFGIAKLVEPPGDWRPRSHDSSALTREIGKALTPGYAAPEQLSGGEITTATDVYALGVLLYVLLTGTHPAGEQGTSQAELLRSILVADPKLPSSMTGAAATAHAERCRVTARALTRMLTGDLDAIVARALQKNPDDRYGSVAAFAEDIRRHLRRQPVSARPDTVRYRMAAFVRRNLAGVAATVSVVVLIVVLTTIYAIDLANERDRATREAAKATKVRDLVMGLLTSVDPYAVPNSGSEPTVRGLLDRGAARVRTELSAEPALQVELMTTIGRTYRRLGVYDRGQVLLEEAIAIAAGTIGEEDVRVAQALDSLGVLMADRGEYAAATRHLERALDLRRRLLGPAHEDVAVTLVELGRVLQDQGLNDRAEPLQREALRIRRETLGPDHREVAVSLSDLASVLRLDGALDEAESLLRQSLDLNRRTRGERHPNTGTSLHDLALIDAMRGRREAAEQQLRAALEIHRQALGPGHPVIAVTLNTLAHVLAATGRPAEAATLLDEALAIVKPALGPDHQLAALYMIQRGAIELTRRNPRAAEPWIREGLRVRSLAPGIVPSRRRILPENDWSVPAVKTLLGTALLEQRRFGEAETLLLEAQQELDSLAVQRPGDLRRNLDHLVQLYITWGKPERAAKHRNRIASS